MSTLQLRNVGQIKDASLTFGDLTVLVGPQATGKSIALQLLRLAIDPEYVKDRLRLYGLDWPRDIRKFLDIYLGEGMGSIWNSDSSLSWDGNNLDMDKLSGISRGKKNKEEKLFFIPAQRVLTLIDGWPKPFTSYSAGDPFAVREFSEKLRLLMDDFQREGDDLFPQERRLKQEYRKLLQENIFRGFTLLVDKSSPQKHLVLASEQKNGSLPFMVWSAGQREFVPLLLGLYWLMPSAKVATRGSIQWVVIEELEMGLHPKAISTVLLLIFELVTRGYRVCLSTHSPQVLDALWALRNIRESGGDETALLRMFAVDQTQSMQKVAKAMIQKTVRVYYFDQSGHASDISTLDASSDLPDEAGWGGLTDFSGRANDEVAKAIAKAERTAKR
jgi:hypothetical protein